MTLSGGGMLYVPLLNVLPRLATEWLAKKNNPYLEDYSFKLNQLK